MGSDNGSVPGWLKFTVFLLLCFSVYVFVGDYTALRMLHAVFDLALPDACFLLPGEYSLLLGVNGYVPLDEANCRDVGAPPHQLMGTGIVADSVTLDKLRLLAKTVAASSGALLVCVLVFIELTVLRWRRAKQFETGEPA